MLHLGLFTMLKNKKSKLISLLLCSLKLEPLGFVQCQVNKSVAGSFISSFLSEQNNLNLSGMFEANAVTCRKKARQDVASLS